MVEGLKTQVPVGIHQSMLPTSVVAQVIRPVNISTTNMLLPAVQLVNYGLVAEYIEVTEGTCAEAGYEVIETQDECNAAAATLGLSDVRSSAVTYAGAAATSPAGCFLAQPHSQCEAWNHDGVDCSPSLVHTPASFTAPCSADKTCVCRLPGTGVRPERDDPSSGDLARRRRRLATPAFIAATLRRTRYVKVTAGTCAEAGVHHDRRPG